ncbi:MAG: hypothetical protein ACLP9L_27625 [Thermoguttaceae bacterium]
MGEHKRDAKRGDGQTVVVERWQQLTSSKATLDGNGRTFEQLKAERVDVAV